jgi:hypothetical protein
LRNVGRKHQIFKIEVKIECVLAQVVK